MSARRIVLTVCLIGILALSVGFIWRQHVSTSPSAQSPASTDKAREPQRQGSPPRATKPVVSAHETHEASEPGESGAILEVCGKGKVRYTPDVTVGDAFKVEELEQDISKRWRAALLHSRDPRARATGLTLAISQPRFGQAGGDQPPAADQSLRSLAQLAAGSSDPAIYAIALSQCARSSDKSADDCGLLSASAFAQLDPDNAVAWLLRASQARQAQDRGGEAWAMSRAARADRSDLYVFSLYQYAQADAPPEATAVDRKWLFLILMGIGSATYSMDESQLQGTPLRQASAYCSLAAVKDAGTRERCGKLAEVLTSSSSTLIEYAIGRSIGARSGWSASKLHQTQDLLEARQAMEFRVDGPPGRQSWSCEAVQRFDVQLQERVQLGELESTRAQVERSGKTPAELAEEYHAHIDNVMKFFSQEGNARAQSMPPAQ